MACSSSKRNSASALASSVLPTPVGPRNRNEPVGRFGSLMPARERRTASATALTASLLPDEPLAELGLEVQQLLGLALQEPADRDAGPRRDDRGDVLVGDLLVDHARLAGGVLACSASTSSRSRRRDRRRTRAARPSRRSPSRCARSASMRASSSLRLQVADAVERRALARPPRLQLGELALLLDRASRAAWRGAPSTRRPSRFLRASSSSFSRSTWRCSSSISSGRESISILQPRRGLVDEVDGLVGQLPGRDVAIARGMPRRRARHPRSSTPWCAS